jgi:hypothetical protein
MEQMINTHIWHPDHGFLSEQHRRIAEIIQDYEPTLFLAFVPPKIREANEEYPFALIHSPIGKPQYVVRRLKEDEVNEGLLAWIWASDNERNSPLVMIEKKEAAERVLRLKEEEDRMAAGHEFMQAVIKSPLHTYKHNGKKYQ